MSRISVLFILLSMVIVNSGDTNHSNINNNNNHNKNNSINHSRSHSFHQPYGSTNSTKVVNHPISSVGAAANSKQESQQEQQQQQPQQQSQEQPPRDKRATGDFQLDEAEIARQNQITQQIFAKYLERRLFPHRSTNERIPTISEILPKPTSSTTARPRPRGFSSSEAFHSFRRGGTSKTSGRKRYGNNGQKQNQRRRGGSSSSGAHRQQLIDEAIAESEQDSEPTLQKPEYYADINAEADEVADDGQESLQSVESEQHDQYYSDVFNRDPSENEIDSDCPNCVDESQYTNKWTMPLLKLGEKRYYLGIFFKANWFKAAQYCRYHGMHLASISSQEENDRLEKHIRDFGLGHEHFWTSGTDLADEGIFFWMANGRPITFTNWNAGEPNNFRYENGEEENCLELWNRDGKGLKWNDSPCSFETFFVCEVQPN